MTGNELKIIALLTMTIDHVGVVLFPDVVVLRIIGRLSFPLFAYMVAEGCFHTHDKRRYLAGFLIVGTLCQVVYLLVMHSLEQSIMTTLALGVLCVYGMQELSERRDWLGAVLFALALALAVFACVGVPQCLPAGDYRVDYGLCGVLLVPLVYVPRVLAPQAAPARLRRLMLLTCGIGLVLVALTTAGSIAWVQWFGLAALVLLACYNGKRGLWHMKYVFYVYYPLHLAVIYGISLLV